MSDKKYKGRYDDYQKEWRRTHKSLIKDLGEKNRKLYKLSDEKTKRLKIQKRNSYLKYREKHLLKSEVYRLKRKYGLTLEQVDELLIKQDHKCAICGRSLKETQRHIDHDHITGQVRGILCSRCNIGLWPIEDRTYFERAIKYLGVTGE